MPCEVCGKLLISCMLSEDKFHVLSLAPLQNPRSLGTKVFATHQFLLMVPAKKNSLFCFNFGLSLAYYFSAVFKHHCE